MSWQGSPDLHYPSKQRRGGSIGASSSFFFSVDQVDIRDVEYLGECLEFQVRDISFVRFNSCDNVFIHIIAGQLQLIGQVPLGHMVNLAKFDQSLLIRFFSPDSVLGFGILPCSSCVKNSLAHFMSQYSLIVVRREDMLGCKSETNRNKFVLLSSI